jgi:hypothetical protein
MLFETLIAPGGNKINRLIKVNRDKSSATLRRA